MPTYEYKCPSCHFKKTLIQKISDSSEMICDKCKLYNMVKGPGGGIAVHFKGSGFYETDYKRNDYKKKLE